MKPPCKNNKSMPLRFNKQNVRPIQIRRTLRNPLALLVCCVDWQWCVCFQSCVSGFDYALHRLQWKMCVMLTRRLLSHFPASQTLCFEVRWVFIIWQHFTTNRKDIIVKLPMFVAIRWCHCHDNIELLCQKFNLKSDVICSWSCVIIKNNYLVFEPVI